MPRRIALISCCKTKLALAPGVTVAAKDLYVSPMFRAAYSYAEQVLHVDDIYIISAHYGLLHYDAPVTIYDYTLCHKPVAVKKEWAAKVLNRLRDAGLDLDSDRFFFLAGMDYLIDGNLGEVSGIRNYTEVYKGWGGQGCILRNLKAHRKP